MSAPNAHAELDERPSVAVIGGGAAGFFAAITCAESNPRAQVRIFEQSSQFLTKVAKSGGGRCNVTHACYDPRLMASRYPRGERPLRSVLHRFQVSDAIQWFEARGVKLKVEADGRIFPVSNDSRSVVDCLLSAARASGVGLHLKSPVESAQFVDRKFSLKVGGEHCQVDRMLLATGGTRVPSGARIASGFGHHPVDPVPSLFSFHADVEWLRDLAGLSCEAEIGCSEAKRRETGPVLFTHRGLSGPAVLRLSAWAARALADVDYQFDLRINFLPGEDEASSQTLLQRQRESDPAKKIFNAAPGNLPSRLWVGLCRRAGIPQETRWSELTRHHRSTLAAALTRLSVAVDGQSLNKDEFVTCGGVPIREVDFKTMESRIQPGLHFAGEVLDVDGITGGFNFQAAWSTGWAAGIAMAVNPVE